MSKDGTMRGGARPRSGPKKKALTDKIASGKADKEMVLPEPADLIGVEVPDVKDYMKRKQKDGSFLCAEEVYKDTYVWLKAHRCEKLVNPQLVEQYAMSVARWRACEEAITQFGYLAKHPTTQAPSTSPFVTMSQNYMKQTNQIWFQIFSIVKENSSVEFGTTGVVDPMEKLLSQI